MTDYFDEELFYAVRAGNREKVLECLTQGANPNWVSHSGYDFPYAGITVLNAAVRETGCLTVIKSLLKADADPNKLSDSGNAPLHIVSIDGRFDYLKALLENPGIRVNIQNHQGETSLHLAAAEGHADVAQYLIRKGASITMKDKNGMTPIDSAEQNGHKALAQNIKTWATNLGRHQQGQSRC